MQVKLSKTLEGVIARTAFRTKKEGIRYALKDFLMLELLREEGSLAYQLLAGRLQEWELYQLRLRIEQEVAKQAHQPLAIEPEHFFRQLSNELCARYHEARHISTAHALHHLASDPSTCTARALLRYRITEQLLAELLAAPEQNAIEREVEVRLFDRGTLQHTPTRPTPHSLEQFGTDLTTAALEGRIDPVIGRDREIERIIQILARRKKNNPILVGEAGVGKTAVVEGLALRIAEGRVPRVLQGKRLFALDLSRLVAGTKYRGEFEERISELLDSLKRSQDTILFIDEIHTIVGAGSTQGSLDTANILKPALARGEVQTIGATTLDEYRREIERDAALDRRFQRVVIEPSTVADSIEILRRMAPRYEAHHGVRYTEEALRSCVLLADRYLTDRHLPDKAIDLLDEAGARAHLEVHATPTTHRAVTEVEHERRIAVEAGNFDRISEARIEALQLRAQLDQASATLPEAPVWIKQHHIEQLITSMTGIPIERIAEGEQARLSDLKRHLASRIIGQEEAVDQIARTIVRARTGLREVNRPIGVFLFVGPTGVGKTLLAKELSRRLFDEERGLIRLDMSEYAEKHSIARLIGSPPGYVGYGEGGQLTEAVRRKPYAVVLLDEIEKAHPELFNTLLQLFDEGHLTDGAGRRVDFRNTIIVMTSNIGSRRVAERPQRVGYGTPSHRNTSSDGNEATYRKALEQTFAPELLNRIDRIVLFRSLTPSDVERIIELELAGLTARAAALGYTLRITPRAKERLASLGYAERYGARALKRTLTDQIEEPMAQLIIEGRLTAGDTLLIEGDRKAGIRLRVA